MKCEIPRPFEPSINKEDFLYKAKLFSYLNIFNISLLSGCGIPLDIDSEKWNKFFKRHKLKNPDSIQEFLQNFTPLKCVYSTLNTKLKKDSNIHRIKDEQKDILIKTQAMAIISDIEMAKFLYDNDELQFSLIFYKSVQEKIRFCCTYMRNDEGVFTDKRVINDETDNLEFKEIENNSKLIENNTLFLHSLLVNLEILDNNKYPNFYNEINLKFTLDYVIGLFEMLYKESDSILKSSINAIANLTLVMIKFYKFTYNFEQSKKAYDMIIKCCAELESRTSPLDRIYENREHKNIASLTSTFKAILALIQSYKCTGIYKFKDCAINFLDGLEYEWNNDYKIYFEPEHRRVKLSPSELALIITALNNCSKIDKVVADKASFRLLSIFELCFERAPMHLSIFSPKFFENLKMFNKEFKAKNNGYYPVFCSYIKFKAKKNYVEIKDSKCDVADALEASLYLANLC